MSVAELNADLSRAEAALGRPVARFDGTDGGAGAKVLLLRRDPRCRVQDRPVVSLDSGHPADTNLRTALARAQVERSRVAVWHLVPWYLEDPDGPPRAQAWREAVTVAETLWPRFTGLRRIVLLGGDVQRAWPRFAHVLPDVATVAAPHPSPLAWHRRGRDGVQNADLLVEALRE